MKYMTISLKDERWMRSVGGFRMLCAIKVRVNNKQTNNVREKSEGKKRGKKNNGKRGRD
jgi:hypothetical protein